MPSDNFSSATAKSLQSCLTLCDPIDGSPPGSPFPGILQARTLEWVAISFSNAWKWKVKVKSLSRVRLLVTPWCAAYQAPPSMGFSRQGYWSGLPWPSPIFRWTDRQECWVVPRCTKGPLKWGDREGLFEAVTINFSSMTHLLSPLQKGLPVTPFQGAFCTTGHNPAFLPICSPVSCLSVYLSP